MITLLHGDNVESSRSELVRLRAAVKNKEVRVFDGKDLTPQMLVQAVESSSLFGGDVVVVIENLFSKLGKKPKQANQYATILLRADTDIIIWEEKEIGAATVKLLGSKANIVPFKLPTLIFQFLDGLRPNNVHALLTQLERLVARDAPELVFTMLVRRVRQLIMAADGVTPEGLQGWQADRLTSQSRLFTMEKLLTMHASLLAMEVSIKTGASPLPLSSLLEQFLIEL